jgi:hypothetical protein
MKPLAIIRTAVFVLLMATIAVGGDKTPPTYQKGTIMGFDTWMDSKTFGGGGGGGPTNAPGASVHTTTRRTRVYELKTATLVYQIEDCGSFQAGKFEAGQTVDFRVDDKRLYILHDGDKEYKCRIEGTRVVEGAKPDAPSTAAPPTEH